MYGSSRKPSNWYELDYDTQRDWEKRDRERQDLEWERDRAQREAEEAREEVEATRSRARRQAAKWEERAEWEAQFFKLPLPGALESQLRTCFESERNMPSRNPPDEYGEQATFEGWLLERLRDMVSADVMHADMEAWQ